MQLVGVAQPGTDLVEHDGHRFGVERRQLGGRDGQPVGAELAQAAAQATARRVRRSSSGASSR